MNKLKWDHVGERIGRVIECNEVGDHYELIVCMNPNKSLEIKGGVNMNKYTFQFRRNGHFGGLITVFDNYEADAIDQAKRIIESNGLLVFNPECDELVLKKIKEA